MVDLVEPNARLLEEAKNQALFHGLINHKEQPGTASYVTVKTSVYPLVN